MDACRAAPPRTLRRRLADAPVGSVPEAGFPDAGAAMIPLLLGDYVISIVSEEMRFAGSNSWKPRETTWRRAKRGGDIRS